MNCYVRVNKKISWTCILDPFYVSEQIQNRISIKAKILVRVFDAVLGHRWHVTGKTVEMFRDIWKYFFQIYCICLIFMMGFFCIYRVAMLDLKKCPIVIVQYCNNSSKPIYSDVEIIVQSNCCHDLAGLTRIG